jgi:FkbM family methyltransferase
MINNIIFNGTFLVYPKEYGLLCFPKDQLNYLLSYLNDDFDSGVRYWITNNCRAHTTFIDIGANAGIYCGLASRQLSDCGRVIAVEPLKSLEPCIRQNVQLNNPLVPFELHSIAIGDKLGLDTFDVYKLDNRVSTLFSYGQRKLADVPEAVEVNVATLNSLDIKTTNHVVIKIDAEGSEIKILRQLHSFMNSRPGVDFSVCFEYASSHFERAGQSVESLFVLLECELNVKSYFIHPVSGAEHPPFTIDLKNKNGNIAFRYSAN